MGKSLENCCGMGKQLLLQDTAHWAPVALWVAALLIFLCLRQHSLMVLMERMYSANPHFVRCIKPNSQKEPGVVDSQVVLQQVRKSCPLYRYFCHILVGRADPTKRLQRQREPESHLERAGTLFMHVEVLGTCLLL